MKGLEIIEKIILYIVLSVIAINIPSLTHFFMSIPNMVDSMIVMWVVMLVNFGWNLINNGKY